MLQNGKQVTADALCIISWTGLYASCHPNAHCLVNIWKLAKSRSIVIPHELFNFHSEDEQQCHGDAYQLMHWS